MPALFTRTSIRPSSARVRSAMAARSAREVTSVGTTLARRLSARTSAAVRSAATRSNSAMTMSAPWRASSSAVARPMPRPAPVTMATCPSSSMNGLPSLAPPLASRQRGERVHETPGVAHDIAIEPPLGATLLHLDAHHPGAVLAKDPVVRPTELLLCAHLRRLVDAGPPSHGGEARARRCRRGLVDLVVPDDEGIVAWRLGRDRAERAEVHEQRAVAVEADDPHVRAGQRDTERDRRALPHRAVGVAVQGAIGDRLKIERRLAEVRDHDLAGETLREEPGGGGARQRLALWRHPCFPPVSSEGRTMATGSERV